MATDKSRETPPEFDYDSISDEELLARCAASRAAQRELDSVHGLSMMQPRRGFSDAQHFFAFMHIFHPEHQGTPDSMVAARKAVVDAH